MPLQLQHPLVMVPDLDEMGNKIIGPNGQPIMVPVPSLDWNPLFEGKDGTKLSSLVQVDVLVSFTDGGKKGNYGIKLVLYGAIKITHQAPRTEEEKYEYDEDDDFNQGLWGADNDDDADDADADEKAAKVADGSTFSTTSVVGLPGVGAQTTHNTNGDEDDDDVPPEERQNKRTKTQ